MPGYNQLSSRKRNPVFTERGGTQYDTRELVGDRDGQRAFLSAFQGSERVKARRAIYHAERLAAFKRATTED